MNRSKKSFINLITALVGQAFGIVISFFARILFVKFFNAEYLGLNGLFTNLLTMLSLVELGVGTAMTYSLYKPLAEEDNEKIKSLMNLYRKTYNIIGIIIIILGVSLLPVYRYLINEVPNVDNLDVIYLLFVLNTAISYFYSYKRSLIICDQKRYIATIYRYLFYFILNLLQIIALVITKNYIIFLVLQIIMTWLENILISIKANKMYPYLKEKSIKKLSKNELTDIKKNVNAMIFHKLGGVMVNSTDNILISKYVGLSSVGIYSNYYLIINALENVTSQFFNAIIASIGNLGATDSNKSHLKETFNTIFLINYLIFGSLTICLLILFNPFIKIWLGQEYLFNYSIVIVICICFYLKGMRKSVLSFKEALGLFWYDRYKPIFESVINLFFSIFLGIKFGVLGIFIGTIISTISTSLWIEPLVLYKYGFNEKFLDYIVRFLKYTVYILVTYILTNLVVSNIYINGIITFIFKGFITCVMSILLLVLAVIKSKEFKHLKIITKNIIKKSN